jgi:hypothetical protein
MKSLLFQLAYQAASTVLLLFYANNLGQQQPDQGRKQRDMKNVLTREDNERGRNASNSTYINLKATENEQCSP